MSAAAMPGAEMVIKALVDQGVDVIFGYPGGAVFPIYDALFKQNQLRHILVRHEQGAVHAAEGYARTTGKVGGMSEKSIRLSEIGLALLAARLPRADNADRFLAISCPPNRVHD